MDKTANNASKQFKECEELFQKKLVDYGTTDIDSIKQIIARMKEKIGRIENLLKNGTTENESVADTLLDLAGYSIIGRLIEMGLWGGDKEYQGKNEVLTINGHNLEEPKYEGDVGYDLRVTEDTIIKPLPSLPVIVPSKVKIAIPEGYYCQIVGRSSAANKLGLLIHTAIIDNGYRGELFSCSWNLTDKSIIIKKGERIGQVIFLPICKLNKREIKELPDSDRGQNGFGSSGK